ncbi:conserved hypothetical protein [groundwater metagenome]|uniref:AMMECR1 domain-containing protein n=1 Tax=groundwater metagenome TaxID=717931 RepID=A0A098E7M6_9ZZZZ
MEINSEEGKFLVTYARKTIEMSFENKKADEIEWHIDEKILKKFSEKYGVFVTIETYPDHELRGCIGFPEPIFPLIDGLKKASLYAAYEDPRFEPLEKEELSQITFEVTVLTPPELIKCKPNEYEKFIEIGRDGLIVRKGARSGLLLPQVPVEWNWNKKEFLEETCMKAGLNANDYLKQDTKVYKFQGIIFTEISPNGDVAEKKLKSCGN